MNPSKPFFLRFLLASLFLGTFALCCNQPTSESDSQVEDSLLVTEPVPVPVEYGMVIGTHVNVRKGPSLDSALVFQVNQEEIVVIEAEGEGYVSLDGTNDICKVYPWVKIKNGSGQSGWVYGKFLFHITESSPHIAQGLTPSFTLEGKKHTLALCHDYGVGASDSEGLTGCEDFHPVIVHSGGWREAHLLEFRSSPHSEYPYWNLINDDGTRETLTALERLSDREAVATVSYSLQDGGGEYKVRLFREKGKWVAEAM